MKTKDLKNKSRKTAGKTIKTDAKRPAPGKSAKAPAVKTAITKKSASVKTAAKLDKIVQKPALKEAVAKKKTVAVKAETQSKAKPKPVVKTDKKVPKKKAVVAKVAVKAQPKARVKKATAVKPKPVVKAEKAVPTKKPVTVKVAVKTKTAIKTKPKPKIIKVSAIKPKTTVKAETKTAKKKAVVSKIKTQVKEKPKAKVKITEMKSKPAVKAVQAVPKKKPVAAKVAVKSEATIKAEVQEKSKAKVSRVSAVKPEPAVKAVKPVPKKNPVVAKIAVKSEAKVETEIKEKPKAKTSKVTALKPKPATKTEKKTATAKKEPAVPVIPALKSGASAKKFEAGQEPKTKSQRYSAKNAKANLKIFLPDLELTEDEAEEIFFGGLPEEYGENSIIALAVDPNTVFIDWEVIPRDISGLEGDLNLRFYDITGIEFNDWNAHSVLDVPINKRVGSGFFDIRMPGRDVVVAVGILNPISGFMPIVRSDTVSFPELLTFDELGIVQKLFASGIPVGY